MVYIVTKIRLIHLLLSSSVHWSVRTHLLLFTHKHHNLRRLSHYRTLVSHTSPASISSPQENTWQVRKLQASSPFHLYLPLRKVPVRLFKPRHPLMWLAQFARFSPNIFAQNLITDGISATCQLTFATSEFLKCHAFFFKTSALKYHLKSSHLRWKNFENYDYFKNLQEIAQHTVPPTGT